MEYKYSEIRDLIFTLSEDVYVGQHAGHDSGLCSITARSDAMSVILQNFLSQYGIKWSLGREPSMFVGTDVPVVKFQLGQNPGSRMVMAIDETVRQMHDDSQHTRNVNNRIFRAMNYDATADYQRAAIKIEKKQAMSELESMVISVDLVRAEDGMSYYYFYFPYRSLDNAQNLLERVGVSTKRYVSHAGGIETAVLRRPSVMLSNEEAEVINNLRRAVQLRQQQRHMQNDGGYRI